MISGLGRNAVTSESDKVIATIETDTETVQQQKGSVQEEDVTK